MLTQGGRDFVLSRGGAFLISELAGHGGPWGTPIGDNRVEITDPGSGLRRRRVHLVRGHLYADWQTEPVDVGRYIDGIGLSATENGPILITIPVRRVLNAGDSGQLTGPLTFT